MGRKAKIISASYQEQMNKSILLSLLLLPVTEIKLIIPR